MLRGRTKVFSFLFLSLIIILCFGVWSVAQSPLPWTRVESDTAVFDARAVDFNEYIVSFNRCVEYVPGFLLTPEEFDQRDDIQVGKVPDGTEISTMRMKVRVPDGQMVGIAGYSVNYASSVFINGKWLFDEGKPGLSLDTERSTEAYRVFSAYPVDGVIEILIQTSSFSNIDTSSAMGWCMGNYEELRILGARKTTIDVVMMSWYILLAVVALLLFVLLPKYKANGWLVLLAVTWAIRTGLKNTKFLLTLFPDQPWAFVFKVEIITSFVTIILLTLIISSVFPKSLPKWLTATMLCGNAAAIAYIILMPWQTFRGHSGITNPIVYRALGLLCVFVLANKYRRKERFTLTQAIHLAGTFLVLFAFVWDQDYFQNDVLPWTLTQPMMLVFTMFMLVGVLLATMQQFAEHKAELTRQVDLREKEILRREVELADSRTAIMLSQIQPHFLYNSLLSIQDLCGRDAELAEKTVGEFSDYLRGNLGSLTNKQCITFEKELEHVRIYLSLETIRFEERLRVAFDIQAKGFMLPALTLQPMVENAIQHGVTKRIEGGKVTIRAREEAGRFCVTVEDDGMGFTPAKALEDEAHVGIQNVRYRLETMCGGSLHIESQPGKGTIATISIPKGESL